MAVAIAVRSYRGARFVFNEGGAARSAVAEAILMAINFGGRPVAVGYARSPPVAVVVARFKRFAVGWGRRRRRGRGHGMVVMVIGGIVPVIDPVIAPVVAAVTWTYVDVAIIPIPVTAEEDGVQ